MYNLTHSLLGIKNNEFCIVIFRDFYEKEQRMTSKSAKDFHNNGCVVQFVMYIIVGRKEKNILG